MLSKHPEQGRKTDVIPLVRAHEACRAKCLQGQAGDRGRKRGRCLALPTASHPRNADLVLPACDDSRQDPNLHVYKASTNL